MIATVLIIVLISTCTYAFNEVDLLEGLSNRISPDNVEQYTKNIANYQRIATESTQLSLDKMNWLNASLIDQKIKHPVFNWDEVKPRIASTLSAKMSSHKTVQESSFVCQSLPKEYDPHYFCSGVVDYPFITPNGVSLIDMETQARTAAMYLSSFINAPCLSDMKRLVCSSLYQPCVPKGTVPYYITLFSRTLVLITYYCVYSCK